MRLRYDASLKISLLEDLTKMLQDVNPYVHTFNALREWVVNDSYTVPNQMAIHTYKRPMRVHERRYNEPVDSELAAIIPEVKNNLISYHRNIILQRRGVRNSIQNMVYSEINVAHRSYDSLGYPLLLTNGEDGWHLNKDVKKSTYTPRQLYIYKLFDKDTEFSTILYVERLFQQYVDAQFFKCEENDL